MRIRLFWRILAMILLVSLVPLAIIGYTFNKRLSDNLQLAAERDLMLELRTVSRQIEAYMNEHLQVIKTTAQLPDIVSMDPKRQEPVLVSVTESNQTVTGGIATLGPNGFNVARGDGRPPKDLSQRLYFQEAMKGVDHFWQTVIGAQDNEPTLIASVPIRQGENVVGVIFTNLNLKDVTRVINEMRVGKTGFVWLVDGENKVMASPNADEVQTRADKSEHPVVQQARAGQFTSVSFTEDGRRWLSVPHVTPQGWVVMVQMEETEIFAPLAEAENAFRTVMIVVAVAVLLLSLLFSLSLSRRFRVISTFVGRMAEGDFTGELKVAGTDEIGDMAQAMRHMQGNLRSHVVDVKGATGAVRSTLAEVQAATGQASASQAAIAEAFGLTLAEVEVLTGRQQSRLESTKGAVRELVAAVDQIAKSSTHQATEVSQASGVVDEVVVQAGVVSDGIGKVAVSVEQVAAAATAGQATVENALGGIQSTKEQVDLAAETVRELGSRSAAISTILTEISAIAGQTNLLALNAAIEAARAGEAGRGFAVVAEEVRRLADRSVRSAQEINQILAAVQAGVGTAVQVMEQGALAASAGAEQAGQARQALAEIMGAVAASAGEARTIGSAAEALLLGHQRLAATMTTLAAVTEENSAAAEEMAASSETVSDAVQELDTLAVQNFAAIQGVSHHLEGIEQAIARMVTVSTKLTGVSDRLTASTVDLQV